MVGGTPATTGRPDAGDISLDRFEIGSEPHICIEQ